MRVWGFGAVGEDRVSIERLESDGGLMGVQLDSVVERLNAICRTATLDLAFQVGQCVITWLFCGDSRLWEREGARRPSYRALAARGDLALSASALCRAVGVYVLVERLGGLERFRYLTASHFQEVLPLDAASQRVLLDEAEANHWSVARLRSAARSCNLEPPRSRHPTQLRAMQRISDALSKHRDELTHRNNFCPHSIEAGELLASLRVIRAELDALEALLECTSAKSDIVE